MSLPPELKAVDRAHVWRPYTSNDDHQQRDLLVIKGAEGPWLIDDDGKRYFDGSGSWWCNNLGHQHPRLIAALKEQADVLMHCTFAGVAHEQATLLAKELVEVAPDGMNRVFFSDDGSTSVEVALKIAFQYWQQNNHPERIKFMSLPDAYHGDTLGAMSVGASDSFSAVFSPLLFNALRPPEPLGNDWKNTLEWIEAKANAHAEELAAIVIEPMVQGAAGMRTYPASMLKCLRKIADGAGTLLICDEVFTGFGRTGPMWASDHASITPDLLCTAKGLSGGVLPFAATLATERVYQGFSGDKTRALMHGHTFCGNPLGARVAREVLAIYRDEAILENAKKSADVLNKAFSEIAQIKGVTSTRSLGMVAAADVGETGYHGAIGWEVHEAALRRGAHIRPLGNTVYVVPPLNIALENLKELLSIVTDSIDEVMKAQA